MGIYDGISKLVQIFKNFAGHPPENTPSDNIEARLNTGAKHIKAIGTGDIVPIWFTHEDAGVSIAGSVTLTRKENERFKTIMRQPENLHRDYEENKYRALRQVVQARPAKQRPPVFRL